MNPKRVVTWFGKVDEANAAKVIERIIQILQDGAGKRSICISTPKVVRYR
ncbi:M35 family metallopeptidase [Candidatus Parcubacteria bacterium]|nr:M35 family metallopeptidase [Candidatus Parcubacteria bacterium]